MRRKKSIEVFYKTLLPAEDVMTVGNFNTRAGNESINKILASSESI